MKADRRTVLRVLASPLLLPSLALRTLAQGEGDALFVIMDDIAASTPADRLEALVQPLLAASLPFGLVLRQPVGTQPAIPDGLAGRIREILSKFPDIAEPILGIPGLAGMPRYFQKRATSDAIGWLHRTLRAGGDADGPSPVTIATEAPVDADFDALRALGIRNVLGLGTARQVSSRGCAQLAVCLRGGASMTVAEEPDPTRWIEDRLAVPGWSQLAFSLQDIEHVPLEEVRLRAQRLVDAMDREVAAGNRFISLPREHARWFGEDQPRFIALRVERSDAGAAPGMDALRAELRLRDIPFTDTFAPADTGGDDGMVACMELQPPWDRPARPDQVTPFCVTVPDLPEPPPLQIAAGIDLLLMPDAQPGFNDRGLYIRGETDVQAAGRLLEGSQRMRDAIIALGPRDCATPQALHATVETLARHAQDPGTRLVDVPSFLGATTVADPLFERLRRTPRDGADLPDPDALSESELLADARQAWTFFERFSVPSTGLCTGTAHVQEGGIWRNDELTMWDLASQISAVMAAHELGLIDDAGYVVRADLLARALPVNQLGPWSLPNEVISAQTGAALSGDFNACDTGRLLSVLREFDRYPLSRGIAQDRIARWNLGAVVLGGHVHSVVNGRLADRFGSQCAHYTARAFRQYGIDAASPYETLHSASQTDREMGVIAAAAAVGPLGAEPLLLEALEMGLSAPSALLADILLDAQRREHESTGTLYCVSEAPLDREPWFTYQGLVLGASPDQWVVNPSPPEPRFATEAFRRDALLVNTKAAYLWSATRPCVLTTLLARHVRERARLADIGFAPGVFMASGASMPGYADVNTNGIILESIAYTIRGRRPRQAAGQEPFAGHQP